MHFLLNVDDGTLSALYAGFLSLVAVIMTHVANWLKNKKPKKEMKDSIETVVATVNEMKVDLQKVKSEVTVNGGKSMKDAVNILIKQQDEIKDVQQAYMSIMMNSDDEAKFMFDLGGDCYFANDAACNLFGMYYKELLQFGWLEAIGTSNLERSDIVAAWNSFRTQRIPFKHNCTVVNQETGLKQSCVAIAREHKGPDGKLLFYLVRFCQIK